MKKERVTKDEIQAAMRQKGFMKDYEVSAVVLETDGSFSILTNKDITFDDLKKEGLILQ